MSKALIIQRTLKQTFYLYNKLYNEIFSEIITGQNCLDFQGEPNKTGFVERRLIPDIGRFDQTLDNILSLINYYNLCETTNENITTLLTTAIAYSCS